VPGTGLHEKNANLSDKRGPSSSKRQRSKSATTGEGKQTKGPQYNSGGKGKHKEGKKGEVNTQYKWFVFCNGKKTGRSGNHKKPLPSEEKEVRERPRSVTGEAATAGVSVYLLNTWGRGKMPGSASVW